MGQKLIAPQGSLRDLRFLLMSSVAGIVPSQGMSFRCARRVFGVTDQPLAEYRAEMAAHRTSSTASKARRGSTKKRSPKPSAARTKRSASLKAKTAASSSP